MLSIESMSRTHEPVVPCMNQWRFCLSPFSDISHARPTYSPVCLPPNPTLPNCCVHAESAKPIIPMERISPQAHGTGTTRVERRPSTVDSLLNRNRQSVRYPSLGCLLEARHLSGVMRKLK